MTTHDHEEIRRKLYQLACIVIASNDVHALEHEPLHLDWPTLATDYEIAEVRRLLVECAAFVRLSDDRWMRTHDHDSLGSLVSVGKLREPEDSEERILRLREACNKILHADRFEPQFMKDQSIPSNPPFLSPYWMIYGRRNGSAWKAELDVVAFAFVSARCVSPDTEFPSKPEDIVKA